MLGSSHDHPNNSLSTLTAEAQFKARHTVIEEFNFDAKTYLNIKSWKWFYDAGDGRAGKYSRSGKYHPQTTFLCLSPAQEAH